jgi:hypothetical protein
MKESTRYDGIYEGDIFINHFVGDLWIVTLNIDHYELWLVPNSGYIGHSKNEYPAHREDLEDLYDNESFEKLGNKYDNPEILKGLNYN